jgi:DNA-3-methyladenine glycosylase II
LTSEPGKLAPSTCLLPLPQLFRTTEFFEFHQRDPQSIAEKVQGSTLHKGIVFQGCPALLTIDVKQDAVQATLKSESSDAAIATEALPSLVSRMLGLDQPISLFEHTHTHHPEFGSVLSRQAGLRVPLAASPFEALTWAVTGQQISLQAAIALRRKLIVAVGVRHSSGLYCYPDAVALAKTDLHTMKAVGFSQSKAQTLLTLASMVVDGTLPLERWVHAPDFDEIQTRLLAIRGIGPWTVSYALLRGFGWLDGALHGDAGVRRGLQKLLKQPEPVTEAQAKAWLAPFTPWRALAAAHLWAFDATEALNK